MPVSEVLRIGRSGNRRSDRNPRPGKIVRLDPHDRCCVAFVSGVTNITMGALCPKSGHLDHRDHRQGGEDPVDPIQLERDRGEAPRFGRQAPHRPHEVRCIGGGEHLVDEPGVLAVGRKRDHRLFEHGPVPHQPAPHQKGGRAPVVDRDARVDAAILAAHRDQGIPDRADCRRPRRPRGRGCRSAGPRRWDPRPRRRPIRPSEPPGRGWRSSVLPTGLSPRQGAGRRRRPPPDPR